MFSKGNFDASKEYVSFEMLVFSSGFILVEVELCNEEVEKEELFKSSNVWGTPLRLFTVTCVFLESLWEETWLGPCLSEVKCVFEVRSPSFLGIARGVERTADAFNDWLRNACGEPVHKKNQCVTTTTATTIMITTATATASTTTTKTTVTRARPITPL